MNDKSQILENVEKVTQSRTLHGSESLCRLLRYLAKQSLDHPGAPVKEYQIATELFGRQSDFDPQVDSMVRVQAGRLRSKLAEYYASEGAEDHLSIELPKGSYLLTFHPRGDSVARSASLSRGVPLAKDGSAQPPSKGSHTPAVAALSALLIAALLGIAFLLPARRSDKTVRPTRVVPPAFSIFWHGFLGSAEPWIIFSNAAFVGRPDTGLRYYDASRDANSVIFDHYTGVGEVLAVHNLDRVFDLLEQKTHVKRGSLFSLDDAKNNDLIFVGSPSENLILLEIPGTQEFKFRSVPSGPRKGNVEIVNAHPGGGETQEYLASPSDVPLTEDYAVIALVRGLASDRAVLILAGTTTFGTQAAVEFVTTEETLQTLLQRLSASKPEDLKPFEALIHIKVARGVPVGSELVAIRRPGS